MQLLIQENEPDLIKRFMQLLEETANNSIQENGVFKIGVSGGSLLKFLSTGLPSISSNFSKWKIFFCDERVVPTNSPDSTFGVYREALVGKTALTDEQFVPIKQGVSAHEAALDYIQKIAAYFPTDSIPQFDLLLLGMGPDGHTCSLFPKHKLLEETSDWVASITDSPKPPAERITLTLPVINNAKCCLFAVSGEGKADMVKRILVNKEDLPAGRVKPTSGRLYWILDKAAAKHVHE